MINIFYIFLGILFFALLMIGAIFRIWGDHKIIALLRAQGESGSSSSFDFIAYKKRLRMMDFISLILLIGLMICFGVLINHPSESANYFLVVMVVLIEIVMIILGTVFQLNLIKELKTLNPQA